MSGEIEVFDLILISKILEHFLRLLDIFVTDGDVKLKLHITELPGTFDHKSCMINAVLNLPCH